MYGVVSKIKRVVKRLLGPVVVKKLAGLMINGLLINVYKKEFKKKVLISYIKEPFKKNSLSHTNYYEVTAAATIFDALGYCVDVMHYEGRVPSLDAYDVIYGFGDVFKARFENSQLNAKTIYYGAGMHVCHQNNASLRRVKDVFEKKGVWLCGSARYVEKIWSHQTALVDGIIALGNSQCADSYRKYYRGPVLECPAPFFQEVDYKDVLSTRAPSAKKSYLWFGSSGLIHKGLDLCLDYFKRTPDLDLHVCGNVFLEPNFVEAYRNELFSSPNIYVHGFVDISSEKFKEILRACSFVIFPSCSEGGAPSVLTVVGNGALVPIISKETSVATGYEIPINSLTAEGLAEAVSKSQKLSEEEVVNLQIKNAQFVVSNHGLSCYFNTLRDHIEHLLG